VKTRHVFVYGSLRRAMPKASLPDGAREARGELDRLGRLVGSARIRGRLIDLGAYPALVDGAGWVSGDLYESDTMDRLIAALDAYEDSAPASQRGRSTKEYYRTRRRVQKPDGSFIDAFVYVYNRAADTRPLIPVGDYLAWLAQARPA
jgi:gamma-glutamylcyclotransferase (GGCT)/AIG2-like uncharacterized protein YtfP